MLRSNRRFRLPSSHGGSPVAKIVSIEEIAPAFKRYVVEAPEIARKHQAGQFVIVLMGEHAERIPLTIADNDPEAGTITLVVQEVGKSTMEMGTMKAGDPIQVVGPLGKPTHIENFGTCVCIGGGAGIAPMLPIARALKAGRKQGRLHPRRSQRGSDHPPPRNDRGVARDDLHHR